mgnify:CR=1 FL=1
MENTILNTIPTTAAKNTMAITNPIMGKTMIPTMDRSKQNINIINKMQNKVITYHSPHVFSPSLPHLL